MEERLIAESLSPIEREVLPVISNDFQNIDNILNSTEDKTKVLRAVSFLKNKGLVETKTEEKKLVILGILGINYQKKQLPERRLLDKLSEKKSLLLSEIKNSCGLNDNEVKAALGALKKKAMIEIKDGRVFLSALPGESSKKMLEEILMEKLPMDLDSLEPQDKLAFQNLQSRKDIVKIEEQKIISVRLTDLGQKVLALDVKEDLIEQLTPKILKQNKWKGKKFRRYDLSTQVPRIYGGKRHFVNQAVDYARSIWLEMGFKEMRGGLVQIGFWNFDTLFTAQDHPAREMQDTFYLKDLEGKIPQKSKNKKECLVHQTKIAHEGGIDGSKGWQEEWSEEVPKRVLLRTHTTSLSSKTLYEINKKKEFPSKYFALGKCFRNETVDWSHGFEFNQTEGIVVDENANFKQLLGYLVQFFNKMGYEKIRIRPAYFPYTEPSLEIDIFHPVYHKWLELGGAGIFRPEVTVPIFGRHIPVLAWGPGFDRIIMEFYGIKDLREMYKNDINKLREIKFWRK